MYAMNADALLVSIGLQCNQSWTSSQRAIKILQFVGIAGFFRQRVNMVCFDTMNG